jgi:(S)-sulfolactate dehydrogenase
MRRIVISEFMDERAVERLKAAHDVLYDPALVDDPLRLLSECVSADALIVRNRTQVRGELLDALRRCKVVGRLGVGLDNIDVAGCEAMGLRVVPATGANAASVAEYVIAAAVLLLRGAGLASADVAAGRWPRAALSAGREIAGKTLGLVGYGSIGRLVAQKAGALGMQVLVSLSSRAPQAVALDELVARSDVVSLHVPLADDTRGLFDAERIAAMKRGAVLINTARGGIVDEAALAGALRSGALGGAALDVFEREPLPHAPHFENCPNLLLTPHIAGVTVESNERVGLLIADEVLQALA